MIPFFRKIRKKMADDNKPLKYMRYAIGEIVLVVIGILIALQINNWNEEQKQLNIKTTYYKQLLIDFNQEKIMIEVMNKGLDKSISIYDSYMETYNDSTANEEDILSALFKNEILFIYAKFNTGTIETLQNTGEIKLLSQNIRTKLINFKKGSETREALTRSNYDKYLSNLYVASENGFNDLMRRLKYQDDLRMQIQSETSIAKLITTADMAFRIKNFTEINLKISLASYAEEIATLEELINQEMD